jgi:hypothetical protein
MLWSGPRSLSSGAVALEQRGEIGRYVPGGRAWDAKMAPTSCLLEAFQIGIIPLFFLFRNNDGITNGRFLTRKTRKTYSHIGFSKLGHVVALGTITPSLVVSSPIAQCLVSLVYTHGLT